MNDPTPRRPLGVAALGLDQTVSFTVSRLLVLSLILAMPGVAWGAWVLWESQATTIDGKLSGKPVGQEWLPVGRTGTADECQAEVASLTEPRETDKTKTTTRGDGLVTLETPKGALEKKKGLVITIMYRCLPAGVDPQ